MRIFISFDRIKWRFTGLTHINECGIKEWYLDNFINCNLEAKHIVKTRMHSSRVYTIYCSSHLSCHAYPPPTCMPPLPWIEFPLPHTLPATHPHHTCPLSCTPLAIHASFTTHAPPAMHAASHTCPPAMHAPLCHTCPEWQMFVKTYLSTTTVADGNNVKLVVSLLCPYCIHMQVHFEL